MDALAQFARENSRYSVIASIDSALHLRLIRSSDVAALVASRPHRLKIHVQELDGRAMSGTETTFRLAAIEARLSVKIQVQIDGVGTVDNLIDDWLVVEIDSRQFHDEPTSQHRDRVRDGNSVLGHFGHLRFDYALIQHELPWCLEVVLARLAEGRP